MAKPRRRLLSGFLAGAFMLSAAPGIAFGQAVTPQQPPAVVAAAPQPAGAKVPNLDVAGMTEWRHDIHAHPETAFAEVRTAEKINDLLKSWGLETHTNVGKTGVVGILKGRNTGPDSHSICLRADIDALPITETTTNLPYASTTPGKAHACGHDGHTAMLLGAAEYLAKTKNFTGTVYFIFQPAEENGGGAKAMIDDDLWSYVKCDGIYGMHDWPTLQLGQMAISPGNITANSDNFSIKITGKGGHAAYPANNIDVISMAADIVKELHDYADKEVPATEGAVLAVTMLHGGEAPNAMPDRVELGGTVRTFTGTTQDKLEQAIKDIPATIAEKYGARVEVAYDRGYPSVFNSAAQVDNARAAAAAVVGKDNVKDFPRTMAGEDFSFYTEHVPGAYIALGIWDGKSPKVQLHSPNFDFNDAALETGASYWVRLVEGQLPLVTPPPAPAAAATPVTAPAPAKKP